eukprot:TRINITY_DN17920_c0_g1_i2.p1 TRINITY_DN17920_c0_g1~~TRINITY_DN17920_c0_g1_i2.p1  ORF type:complete len:166 (-),score=43.81 TRINITY_DN17920_c0_g1_i2:8-505(-)
MQLDCTNWQFYFLFFFFFNDTATTEIYTLHIVGSVRCVQETASEQTVKQQGMLQNQNPITLNEKKEDNSLNPQADNVPPSQQQEIFSPSQNILDLNQKLDERLNNKQTDTEYLSLIHISEPTRLGMISYAVFCLKKKKINLTIKPKYIVKRKLIPNLTVSNCHNL